MPKPTGKPAASKPAQQQNFNVGTTIKQFLEHVEHLPKVFFDRRDGSYWIKLRDKFDKLSARSIAQHMIRRGLTKDVVVGIGWRQCDYPCLNAEENNAVDYAGPLGGHRVGLWADVMGKKSLVTQECDSSVWDDLPRSGEPKFFLHFIQELLPDDQWLYFCYWLAWAYGSLRRIDFRLGQMIFFAGPKGCGKSLAQWIVTQVLGGRAADPWAYMFEEAKFNKSMIQAEHWMIEDPPSSTDLKSRRNFGERIKACTNNRDFIAHTKGKDEERVTIFRRVTCSINDETEHLAVIPPLVEGTGDKIMLFKCSSAVESVKAFVVGDEQQELKGLGGEPLAKGMLDEQLLQATIRAELPVLRGWLMRVFSRIPPEMADPSLRNGIRFYHHPELLAEVNALAPEEKLLTFIDQVWWDEKFPTAWTGKSTDMDKVLRDKHPKEAERLLWGANPFGSALKKLIRRYPERISKRVLNGHSIWTILPPLKMEEKENGSISEKESATAAA